MAPTLLVALLLTAFPVSAQLPGIHIDGQTATLRVAPACVLHAVANDLADQIGRYRDPAFEARLRAAALMPSLPAVHLESRTPLQVFLTAVAPQNPGVGGFSNFFAVAANKIFLIDTASYYSRLPGRHIEDSLAHEYMHYIQTAYLGYTVNDLGADDAESMAVEYQGRYREAYVKTGRLPACP